MSSDNVFRLSIGCSFLLIGCCGALKANVYFYLVESQKPMYKNRDQNKQQLRVNIKGSAQQELHQQKQKEHSLKQK